MKKMGVLLGILCLLWGAFGQRAAAGEIRDNFNIEYDGQIVAYTAKTVSLEVDGKVIKTEDMPAVIVDNSTLVPAREVFESDAIAADVAWISEEEEVHITYKDHYIVLEIGGDIAYVDGKPVKLDVPAKLIRDTSKTAAKTMIPIRFVSESLGFTVEWDKASYTAKIYTPAAAEGENDQDGDDQDEKDQDAADESKLPTGLHDNPLIWTYDSSDAADEALEQATLTAENHEAVTIDVVEFLEEGTAGSFIVRASGPVSQVDYFTLPDGRYVMDIHNATSALSQAKYDYSDNPYVSAVRSAQQPPDASGRPVMRIVFDMRSDDLGAVLEMDEDREALQLIFGNSILTGIELGQNEKGDYLLLTGTTAPAVSASRLEDPNRIVLDLPGFQNPFKTVSEKDIDGQYVTMLKFAQYDDGTTRVVLGTKEKAEYVVTNPDDHSTLIQLVAALSDEIDYVSQAKPLITLEKNGNTINTEAVTYTDDYNHYTYTIHLNGDYGDLLGYGNLGVGDDYIDSIEVLQNADGNTDIVIKEKEIYIFKIEKDGKDTIIKAYKPRDLYDKILVVDFGHGGTDPGATNDELGVHEADLNLAIGSRLRTLLDKEPSLKVYYSRPIDEFVTLQGRTDLANSIEADLFLSIHNNSFLPQFTGTETIYFSDADRPGLNSVELAEIMHKHAVSAIGLTDRGIKDNNTLFVLRMTDMPAVIVECAFVSNGVDVARISDEAVQKNLAQALYDGILEVFEAFPTGR